MRELLIAWQDNSSAQTFTVTQAGLYWVKVTNGACTAADTVQVNITSILL